MFEIGKSYVFKIKNSATKSGFVYYTGEITGIEREHIFIYSIKNEKLGFKESNVEDSKELE